MTVNDAPSPRSVRRTTPSVLVADDDAELRAVIAEWLRSNDCDVTEAADGGRMLVRLARAYETAEHPRETYDVIVADVCMPVCTGLQILENLRRAHWQTPVILMTAYDDGTLRPKAEALGALLLNKPFDVEELAAAIDRLGPRRHDDVSVR